MSEAMENSIVSYANNEACIKEYRLTKGNEVLEKLLTANRGLVLKIAHGYKHYHNHDLDLEDLVSGGMCGLLTAIDKYDEAQGAKFSTYASTWIRSGVQRVILEEGSTIRVPVHMYEKLGSLIAYEHKEVDNNREPTKETTCKSLALSSEAYDELKRVQSNTLKVCSLNQPLKEDYDGEVQDLLPRDAALTQTGSLHRAMDPELSLLASDLKDQLNIVLEWLSIDERLILIHKYGLNGEVPKSYDEVSSLLGIRQTKVKSVEAKALRRLKSMIPRRRREYGLDLI